MYKLPYQIFEEKVEGCTSGFDVTAGDQIEVNAYRELIYTVLGLP